MKKELRIGIILLVIYFIVNRFLNAPDLMLGFLMGLGLFLMIIGLLLEKTSVKVKKLKNGSTQSV